VTRAAFENPPDEVIRTILSHPMRVAVVGCSPNPSRDSHEVAVLLRQKGHTVFPVNPTASEILGVKCYPSLLDVPPPIDMVDIFRRSDEVAAIVEDAIRIKARIVWMQLGVIDEVAAGRASDAGLTVVMDRCPAIEYRRLFA
jgi:predicted CoA-binding protein